MSKKLLIPVILIFVSVPLIVYYMIPRNMKIYAYYTELFKHEYIPTEYNTYQLLKIKPLKRNVNYLVVPWSVLINCNQLQKMPPIKLNGGFTVCQHILFEKIIPILKNIGIDTLFTPHVEQGVTYDGVNVLPFPHYAINSIEPAAKKDIWYSFIGFNTHETRVSLFNMPKRQNTLIKERPGWYFCQHPLRKQVERREYLEVMARSRFSLCPRGTGASTVRFWESLRSGSIPVLISDAMMLPGGFDWDSCIIKIAEKDVDKLENILDEISSEKEAEMRKNCLYCYQQFSGQNFVSVIRRHYEKIFPFS